LTVITGVAPTPLYQARQTGREVCTIFLLDLSASTDDPIERRQSLHRQSNVSRRRTSFGFSAWFMTMALCSPLLQTNAAADQAHYRLKSAGVMAEALESIGDEYAIYGFSGYGRDNVEFFVVKHVEERYSKCQTPIDALKPYRSTRMGPPIRHAIQAQPAAGAPEDLILLPTAIHRILTRRDRRGKNTASKIQMAL
jgi:hypothetical protein